VTGGAKADLQVASNRKGGTPQAVLKPPRRSITPRRVLTMATFVAVLLGLAGLLLYNVDQNLASRGLSLSFDFLSRPAGFDIPIRAIGFSPRDTYADAALVGIVNTLVVSALAVMTATVMGFLGGAAVLSPNPLLGRTALSLVEIIRTAAKLCVRREPAGGW